MQTRTMSTLEEMVQAQADKLSVVKQEDLIGSAYCPTDPETKYLCIDGLEYNTSMKMGTLRHPKHTCMHAEYLKQ